MQRTDEKRRGTAMLMVVGILMALAAIATPFAVSMAFHRKSASLFLAQMQAKLVAETALANLVEQSYATHPTRDVLPDAIIGPATDGYAEILQPASALPANFAQDPIYPASVGFTIEDEQGKIHLKTATINLIYNIAGATVLTSDWNHGQSSMSIQDGTNLQVSGMVVVGNPGDPDFEILEYVKISKTSLSIVREHVETTDINMAVVPAGTVVADAAALFMAGINPAIQEIGKPTLTSASAYIPSIDPYLTIHSISVCSLNPPSSPDFPIQMCYSPIHVNTAPRRVLESVFFRIGIQYIDGAGQPQTAAVDWDLAQKLTLRILQDRDPQGAARAVFSSNEQFRAYLVNTLTPAFFDASDADRAQALLDAVYWNAVRRMPASQVDFRSTVPMPVDDNNGTLTPVERQPLILNPTSPFCYKSEDVYTFEVRVLINSPSGLPRARYWIREIVDVSPPGLLVKRMDSQLDFEQFVEQRHYRSTTLPNIVALSGADTAPLAGDLRLWAPRTLPGPYPVSNAFAHTQRRFYFDSPDAAFTEGDPLTRRPEGLIFDGSTTVPLSLAQDGSALFDRNQDNSNPTPKSLDLFDACLAHGCVSFWMRLQDPGADCTIFDLYDTQDHEDRMYLRWDATNQELVFGIADTSIKTRSPEYVAPAALQPDGWHYVQVYYDSDQYRGNGILLDGEPVGDYACGSYLTVALPADTTTLQILVDDAAEFDPNGGAIRIGDEIIHYTSADTASNTLLLTDAPNQRARRGTILAAHPIDRFVEIYGYRAPFDDDVQFTLNCPYVTSGGSWDIPMPMDLHKGGGTLAHSLPENSTFTVIGIDPPPPGPGFTYIAGGGETFTLLLSVNDTDYGDMPDEGWIRVKEELIKYSSKKRADVKDQLGNTLQTNVPGVEIEPARRAQFGTQQIDFPILPYFEGELCGFEINGNGGNPPEYPDYAAIELTFDNAGTEVIEWIAPLWYTDDPISSNKLFLVPVNDAATPAAGPATGMGRRFCNTPLTRHLAGEEVRQVIRYSADARNQPGIVDRPTLVDNNGKEEVQYHHIRHRFQWLSLDAFTTNAYDNDAAARFLLSPSGELPASFPNPMVFGGSAAGAGGMVGGLDDIVFGSTSTSGNVYLDTTTLGADLPAGGTDPLIPAVTIALEYTGGGYCRVGREWIGYGPYDSAIGGHPVLERGAFASTESNHVVGDSIELWTQLLDGALDLGGISDTDGSASLLSDNHLPPTGTLQVEEEALSYWSRSATQTPPEPFYRIDVSMPLRKNAAEGLYRGVFGSLAATHDEFVPVRIRYARYTDGYAMEPETHDQNSTSIRAFEYQRHYERQARWDSIAWDAAGPADTRLRVFARFDEYLPWTSSMAGPWKFPNLLELPNNVPLAGNAGIQADVLELLLQFHYDDGAFASGAWHYSPRIRWMELRYKARNVVLFHEEMGY